MYNDRVYFGNVLIYGIIRQCFKFNSIRVHIVFRTPIPRMCQSSRVWIPDSAHDFSQGKTMIRKLGFILDNFSWLWWFSRKFQRNVKLVATWLPQCKRSNGYECVSSVTHYNMPYMERQERKEKPEQEILFIKKELSIIFSHDAGMT